MFDRLRSLSARQQILLVALLVSVTCVIVGSAWFLFLRVSYQPAFTELRPTDAAAIIADLERKKIPYELANGGTTILVPSDMVDRTRLNVMTGDVSLKGTIGFELFDRSDMGLTDFAQKINYQRALQGELERTIATLDGVDSARVHLSLGEDRIFRDDRVPPKASVTIRMQKGFVLPASAAQGIQRLIAAAVPNLEVANVVILDEKGQIVGPEPQARRDADPASPLAQEKRAIEQYYQARARQALDRAYPLEGMTVDVSAGITNQLDGASSGLPDWNPSARNFPLTVTVSSTSALDSAALDNVRNLVAGVVGFDPAKNDAIVLTNSAAAATVGVGPALLRRPEPMMSAAGDIQPPEGVGDEQMAITFAVLLALAGAAGFFVWKLRRPRRLSDAQRADFAAKFRTVLEQGDSHVAS